MRFSLLALTLLLCLRTALSQAPQIVETSPKFWETGVRPTSKEVSVTFDQPLRYGFSSWLGAGSVLPETEVESNNSADGRVFGLSVGLEPGKVYAFALNEREIPGVGFQSPRGIPLRRHFLVFQTAGTPAPEDAPPRAVSTIPPHTAQQLDATRLKALTITFDRPMQATKHGLHMTENGKPVDLSTARFEYSQDGKTFVLAYEFKSSSAYQFELNNTQDIGFASSTRIPLWPVRLAFSTGQPQL